MTPQHYTLASVAATIGRSPETIRENAIRHGIGSRFGRCWMFSQADIASLRAVVQSGPGRPKKETTK